MGFKYKTTQQLFKLMLNTLCKKELQNMIFKYQKKYLNTHLSINKLYLQRIKTQKQLFNIPKTVYIFMFVFIK